MKNNTTDEMKEFRIDSLKKLIPELIERREKKASKRLIIVFVTIYLLSFIFLLKFDKFRNDIIGLFLLPVIISVSLIFISYIIGFVSFFKNQHETMIIEKLKTELATLSNKPEEDIDMLIEIGKIRSFL